MVSDLDIDIKNMASLYRVNLNILEKYRRFNSDVSLAGFIQWLSENNYEVVDRSIPPPDSAVETQ
jgi:hypothetical protein